MKNFPVKTIMSFLIISLGLYIISFNFKITSQGLLDRTTAINQKIVDATPETPRTRDYPAGKKEKLKKDDLKEEESADHTTTETSPTAPDVTEPSIPVTKPRDRDNLRQSNSELELDPNDELDQTTPNPGEKSSGKSDQKKNVLFLMADDMRPQLNAYLGQDYPTPFYQKKMVTPNFDRLAKESIVFLRNYVQYSLCGPSRTSLLTSRRPDVSRIFGNEYYWRTTGGNFTTLPQYFKSNGYHTIGVGKVFHPALSSNNSDPISWTEPFFSMFSDGKYHSSEFGAGWVAVEPEARKEIPLTDEYAVDHTISRLRDLAPEARTGEKPFFLALGFRKPHISLVCPKEYYDLYPLETKEQYLSDVKWQTPEVGFPMENATRIDGVYTIEDEGLRYLRRGYFACISFVDDLLGDVLDELEKLKLMDNTVISFVADHGYHIGENNHWGKYIATEMANHVPMMIRIPGKTEEGIQTRSLTEAVDLFPTIVEAAGLTPIPKCPRSSSQVELCTDGTSLMPLVENPDFVIKEAALSQVLRGTVHNEYSLRTDRYRYVAFGTAMESMEKNGTYEITFEWETPEKHERALYDHKFDPEERVNRIHDWNYKSIVKQLQIMLESLVTPVQGVPTPIPRHH